MAKSIQARIDILVDAAKAQAALKRVTRETDKFNRSTKNVKGNPFKSVTRSVVGLAGAYIGAQGLITVIQGSIREQQESIKVGRQTNAVLKSTKSAAGLSAKAISDLAQALSEKTAVDDEAIQSAENLLLTFTKIGKDTFPAATAAVLDLSAATGTSLKGASIQVGKALQDPVRGLTALRKVGVNFSTDQQEVIKKLVATGKTAEAQKLILKELATEFGGSAAAQATPLDRLKVTYQNLLETIGGYLVPILNDVAEATMKFVEQFRDGKGAGGEFKDTLKGIYDTLKPIVAFLINHPAVVAGAAAAYIAFKATLAALNLYDTIITSIGTVQGYAAAGGIRGRAFSVALGVGLVVGIPLALAGIADMISQRLIPKNMSSQMQGAFGFTGGIAERFSKWWAHLKGLASAGWSFLKNLFAGKGSGGTMGFIQAPSFKGLPKIISSVQSTMSDAVRAVTSKAGAFISAGGQLVSGLASGIRRAAGQAMAAAGDLAASLPKWVKKVLGISSPSKVFAEIGASIVAGMAAGMSKTAPITKAADKIVKAATPSSATAFGLGGEVANQQDLLKARALIASSKGKAKTNAQAALSKLEAKQAGVAARSAAQETLKGFVRGITDQIKASRLASIMAPITAARDARAGREFGTSSAGLGSAITRAQAEAADPRVQAKYQRDAARLDARMVQARKSGNLEAIDSLQNEKDALDARYGPKYLTELQDQLAQLNENEIERTSEAAATAFADTFTLGMKGALDTLFAGGTVETFFNQLKAVLAPSGLSPGAITGGAGAGEAAAMLSGTASSGAPVAGGIKTWTQRILEYVKGLGTGPHKASDIAKALGTTQANVYKNRPNANLFKGHGTIVNKASGGYLTPGALTMVGETGPELIVGGRVHSATRTNRMGGGQGMNITVNAVGAAADDPMLLARQLGWQLATR